MHGATPSFKPPKSPRIHLRTAHGRALPYPATYKQAILRRSRTSLVFACLLLTTSLYYLTRDPSDTRGIIPPPLRKSQVAASSESSTAPSLDESKFIVGPPVPDEVAQKFHLEGLPVRIPVQALSRPSLPVDSVFSDPWPDRPEIVKIHLSSTKFSNLPMALPHWPTEDDSEPVQKPKFGKIPWKSLFRPQGYKGPVALERLSDDGTPGVREIQRTSFAESDKDIDVRRARQEWVKRAFLHAWGGYKSQAWGHDEVKPLTGLSSNGFNGWGATIVDSLSTLLLLNLTEEYSLARTHVRQIDFTTISGEKSVYGQLKDSRTVPIFETIIRYLGGLLSAYDLSGGDPLMLERAEDLAGWLMGAFE